MPGSEGIKKGGRTRTFLTEATPTSSASMIMGPPLEMYKDCFVRTDIIFGSRIPPAIVHVHNDQPLSESASSISLFKLGKGILDLDVPRVLFQGLPIVLDGRGNIPLFLIRFGKIGVYLG